MKKKGIILAAGNGTRLGNKLKCLLQVDGKTLIDRNIEKLVEVGITDIAIVIQEKYLATFRYLVKKPEGVSITYIFQHQQKGVGHALLQAEYFVGQEHDDIFIVILGDNLIKGSLHSFVDGNFYAKIGVNTVSNPSDYGIAAVNDHGEVEYVIEKPSGYGYGNLGIMGVYRFNKTIFRQLKLTREDHTGEIQLTYGIGRLIEEQYLVTAELVQAHDIGTPERYATALTWLQK